jgi:site-specific DNA recombinase
MKRTGLYIRVSTTRQEQEGYSIPLQKERLISYCKAKGWAVAGVFIDPGHSGSSLERPGITALVDGVKAGKFDVVLVYKLDRLSRSQRDTLFLIEDIFMANSTDFVSMQESFDTSSIYGRAMLGVLSVFAQMERETITERTLMGRAGRAEDGYWHGGGTDPIGYDYIDGELVINEEEAEQVRDVYALYASGFSVTEISRRMDGRQTKHGDWSHTSTVGNVLDNPLYAGMIHFDDVLVPGRHMALVSQELDKKVKARRSRLLRAEVAGDSAYLLTSMIYCDSCGARYFPNKRPNGRVVYSCHSRAKKNKKMVRDPNCKAPHIPVEDLDAMVVYEVLSLAANPVQVDALIKKEAADGGGSEVAGVSEEIKRLDGEISRLMDLLQHDQLASVGDIAERISKVHAERMKLEPDLRESVPRHYDIEMVKGILYDIRYVWSSLDVRVQRSYLLQLLDGVHIDGEGIRFSWSFV